MSSNLVIDLTGMAKDPPGGNQTSHYKLRGGKVLKRDPKTVTGITLHQMGTDFAVSPGQIKVADGDSHKALHRRALNVHAHVSVFDGKLAGVRCGHAIYAHPLEWYVYHGDKLNSRSLGLEVEGKFPLNMRPGEEKASAWLIRGARAALKFMVEEGRRKGMPIKYIWAHRQSSKDRAADPGEELWKKLVIDYAVPVLGLKMQPDLVVGDGRPIPENWGRVGKRSVARTIGTATGVGGGIAAVFLVTVLAMRAMAKAKRKSREKKPRGMSGLDGRLGEFGFAGPGSARSSRGRVGFGAMFE